jgi:UDP-GlcNAc:undecaprenyl-phosphate/decaprenyl-phosphate GlcNAc-1-phosphate transferase
LTGSEALESVTLAALVLLTASALSFATVPAARFLGRRLAVMDHPGERKVHRTPTPRTGGWAIYLSFLITVTAGYFALPLLAGIPGLRLHLGAPLAMLAEAGRVQGKLSALMIGATLAFLVGLIDDVIGSRFPVVLKAAGQLTAAAILIAADVRVSVFPSEWLNVVVTLLWVFGITNAFNLLDNMDGLSAGVALTACVVLLLNAWTLDEFFISLLLLAIIGCLSGFLFFNLQPSSIFLGDSGSHFIGYLMAAVTLLERYVSHASSSLFPVLMPLLVLAVPIMDTTTVVAIRLRERRPIYVGDKRHLSHQLVARGFSQREAVLFLYLATFGLGLGAASLTDATLGQSLLILLQSICFVVAVLWLIFTREPQ